MKAKVLSYARHNGACSCELEDGSKHLIDLVVDGSLGDMREEDLVGKTVEFDSMHAFISIAHGVRIVDEMA